MLWKYEPEPSKYGNRMLPALKQLIIFLVGWLGFQIFASSLQLYMGFFAQIKGMNADEFVHQVSSAIIVNSATYLALLIAIVLIANVDLLKLFKSFKQWQSYVAGLVCLVAILAFDSLWSFILELLPLETGDNLNESSLGIMISAYPIASLLIFGIVGPICEEFTYRVGLFSFFRRKSRWLAYLLTIIIFASIHFNFSKDPTTLLNEVLNLPFYLFAAFAFSYTYEKFGLAGSLSAHVANNLISLIATLINEF